MPNQDSFLRVCRTILFTILWMKKSTPVKGSPILTNQREDPATGFSVFWLISHVCRTDQILEQNVFPAVHFSTTSQYSSEQLRLWVSPSQWMAGIRNLLMHVQIWAYFVWFSLMFTVFYLQQVTLALWHLEMRFSHQICQTPAHLCTRTWRLKLQTWYELETYSFWVVTLTHY